VENGMMLVQQLLEVVGIRARGFGVEIGDVGYQVDKIVKLFGVIVGSGRGGRDKNLALGVVGEPLVVELLGVGPD